MQSLVKTLVLLVIAILISLPATAAVEGAGPGPIAKQQSQNELTFIAAANTPVKHAGTMQTTQQLSQSKTSLLKHTKTHPAAILLLVMAIAGVFLLPALLERCSPSWVSRFEVL